LPVWPALGTTPAGQFLHIDVNTRAESDLTRERYLLLDQLYASPAPTSQTR